MSLSLSSSSLLKKDISLSLLKKDASLSLLLPPKEGYTPIPLLVTFVIQVWGIYHIVYSTHFLSIDVSF